MVTWESLPPALAPGEGDEPDADGVWTGSLIEAGGVLHLFYTGHKLGAANPQTICHATSRDGVVFAKDRANPILAPDTSIFEPIDWRDPYVLWNEAEQRYWMIIAARLNHGPKWRRGCIALATSTDLIHWSLEREPLYSPLTTFCPECPELFRLGNHWYLVFSRFSERVSTVYRIADTPRGPWRTPMREAFDGRRWYASKSLPKDDSTRTFFGWIHDRAGDTDDGAWLWGGDFAAPRDVTADRTGALHLRLPADVIDAYSIDAPLAGIADSTRKGASAGGALQLRAEGGTAWRFIDTELQDYLFSFRLSDFAGASNFGLLFRADDDLGGYVVEFDRKHSTVALVHWPQPLDTFWAALVGRQGELREADGPRLVEHPFDSSSAREIDCHLLVSGSNVELYVADQVALSYRIYGRSKHELGFFVEDGGVKVDRIKLRTAAA
jgi:beta-fructofuranosidase